MKTEKIVANEQVKDDKGKFALQRGPLVYCIEGPDNKDSLVQNILVDKSASVKVNYQENLLKGVNVLTMQGKGAKRQLNTTALLETDQAVTAIPYYSWANRGPSEMTVWIPYLASAARPKPAPTIASTSKVTSSLKNKRMYSAINDQYEPADSKDTNYPYLHWWPAKSSTEYVQYNFAEEKTISKSEVYWFDDGPWGGCRIPGGYKLYYKQGENWLPVKNTSPYSVEKDKINTVTFEPVKTTAIKLEVQLPQDNSSGIHEWAVE